MRASVLREEILGRGTCFSILSLDGNISLFRLSMSIMTAPSFGDTDFGFLRRPPAFAEGVAVPICGRDDECSTDFRVPPFPVPLFRPGPLLSLKRPFCRCL